jgi:hypothetical protein
MFDQLAERAASRRRIHAQTLGYLPIVPPTARLGPNQQENLELLQRVQALADELLDRLRKFRHAGIS